MRTPRRGGQDLEGKRKLAKEASQYRVPRIKKIEGPSSRNMRRKGSLQNVRDKDSPRGS